MLKRRAMKMASCGLAGLLLVFAQTPPAVDDKALFAARDWTGLERAQSPLYRAAFSIAFNQNPAGSVKL